MNKDIESMNTDKNDTQVLTEWRQQALSGRKAAATQILPAVPPYILQINSCEVAYILHPSSVPLSNLEFGALRDAMQEQYRLTFAPSELKNLKGFPPERLPSSAEELGQFMLTLEDPELVFSNGILQMPDRRAIKILKVRLTDEQVFVSVIGPTKAAEQLICELVPMMWALMGVARPWTEIVAGGFHQVASYGTGTRVQFPKAGLGLLSAAYVDCLTKWTRPSGVALGMGRRDRLHDWGIPDGCSSIFNLDEIHIRFARQEPSGNSVNSRLRIGVDSVHERGSGVLSVDSELPFDEHVGLVGELLAQLG
jgi:hypothetical protein